MKSVCAIVWGGGGGGGEVAEGCVTEIERTLHLENWEGGTVNYE